MYRQATSQRMQHKLYSYSDIRPDLTKLSITINAQSYIVSRMTAMKSLANFLAFTWIV